MSSLDTHSEWSLSIYRVSGDAFQQRILRAFHRIAWPGVTALGTQDDAECFVIVDCESEHRAGHVRGVILRIDPDAAQTVRANADDPRRPTRGLRAVRPPRPGS